MVLKKNNKNIGIGDKFVKTDEPKTIWIVTDRGAPVASIPHYKIVREDYVSRVRTLSGQVLLDSKFYRKVN